MPQKIVPGNISTRNLCRARKQYSCVGRGGGAHTSSKACLLLGSAHDFSFSHRLGASDIAAFVPARYALLSHVPNFASFSTLEGGLSFGFACDMIGDSFSGVCGTYYGRKVCGKSVFCPPSNRNFKWEGPVRVSPCIVVPEFTDSVS